MCWSNTTLFDGRDMYRIHTYIHKELYWSVRTCLTQLYLMVEICIEYIHTHIHTYIHKELYWSVHTCLTQLCLMVEICIEYIHT